MTQTVPDAKSFFGGIWALGYTACYLQSLQVLETIYHYILSTCQAIGLLFQGNVKIIEMESSLFYLTNSIAAEMFQKS